jgi:two-component system response regulator QseB
MPSPGPRAGRASRSLEPRSQALLLHLARERGGMATRQDLFDAVWGVEAEITDNALDVAISTLRKRLAGTGIAVTTVRGQGFRLDIIP